MSATDKSFQQRCKNAKVGAAVPLDGQSVGEEEHHKHPSLDAPPSGGFEKALQPSPPAWLRAVSWCGLLVCFREARQHACLPSSPSGLFNLCHSTCSTELTHKDTQCQKPHYPAPGCQKWPRMILKRPCQQRELPMIMALQTAECICTCWAKNSSMFRCRSR